MWLAARLYRIYTTNVNCIYTTKVNLMYLRVIPMLCIAALVWGCSTSSSTQGVTPLDQQAGQLAYDREVQTFKVLEKPKELTHEDVITWLRENGDYVVRLKKGDLLSSLGAMGENLGYSLRVDRMSGEDRKHKIPAALKDLVYPLPDCASWEIEKSYSIGTNNWLKTTNRILQEKDLVGVLFANDILFITSSKEYAVDFCEGREQ